jgi:hypothetical protein
MPPTPAAPPEPAAPPPAQHRPPTDLDEFLARAVDRQIAEQRALREALQELTNAVHELQARPAPAPAPASGPAFDPAEMEARIARAVASATPAIDPAEIEARIARAVASAVPSAPSGRTVDPAEIEGRVSRAVASSTEVLVNELRDLRSTVLPGLQRATEASSGSRAIEHDMAILRDAVGGVSADVEGIAQALIDLNAGLRDWADGIDQNIEVVKDAVQQARDVAVRAEELQADTLERMPDRRADSLPLLPVEGEIVPDVAIAPRDVTAEIEQRVKETIELSLYLADQIESFDKAIANLGDLPSRLEGTISQALKRTLAARAKLDHDAETALDEAVATLDEHVATIGDLSGIAEMQARLESGLDAIAEAIDRSADGGLPRAGTSLARATVRSQKATTRKRAGARKASRSKAAKTKASKAAKPAPKAKRTTKSTAVKRSTAPKRKPKPRKAPEAEYLSLDADALTGGETPRPRVPDGD